MDGRRTLRYELRSGCKEIFAVDVLCPLRGPERDRITSLRAMRSWFAASIFSYVKT